MSCVTRARNNARSIRGTIDPAMWRELNKLYWLLCDPDFAARVRIQYGGSMKPENARELLSQPDVDGGLIGGAALQADSFLAIVNAAVARFGI